MENNGEHLLIGNLGHFFVLLAFVASLISTIGYFKSGASINFTDKLSWRRFARIAFLIQALSVLTVFFIIFIICKNHYYEYLYAFKHTSNELEPKYLLACIWEDQSGSFLLWSIWHCVLGSLLIWKSKEWEAPVMTVIGLAQAFIALMLLGIYIFDVKIGNSPFALTKNEIEAPFFSMPDYLPRLTRMHEENRMGLNVLLRNYWMVIHPPVLFLGFASTIVPFAFAYAGIQSKRFADWVKPALPWALFSACVLGVGVMMGGKWAYESLNFGGYWAWDPVENAALVPWMVLVSGIHCMVIFKATGQSLRAAYLFSILTFVLILYATFLTRTGILGDASVHAFVEAGLPMKILIGSFVLVFTVPSLILFFSNYKKIPSVEKEEAISSREFWMFIGSLVFFLAAFFIIAKTSWPVIHNFYSWITGHEADKIAEGENAEYSYNKVVILVAVIIGVLTAFTQYFKYKSTPKGYTLKKIAIPTIIALTVTILLSIFYPITYYKETAGFLGAIYAALFAGIYSVVANATYIWTGIKGNMKSAGGSVAHVGFSLMLVGILISAGNKKTISDNRVTGMNLQVGIDPQTKKQDNPLDNLTLARQMPTRMGPYIVTYIKDSAGAEKDKVIYQLLFEKKDELTQKTTDSFYLYPDVYIMKGGGMSSNPDIRNYLNRDVFTYISYAVNKKENDRDTAQFKTSELNIGDTIY
ncbi:MAG: cytochrome c biogenesis protein CcsA, partial [Ferruginibacter sp.]